MSVQSIGTTGSYDWLQQLLASYANQPSTSNTSLSSLLSLSSGSTDETAATSSGSSSTSSATGSFNDILTALLAGNGSLAYDMETGMLTTRGASNGEEIPLPPEGAFVWPGQELTRSVAETANDDGGTTRQVTLTDADGNVVGTENTTENADGSFTSTITRTGPDGKTTTRTVTGENTDAGFKVTNTLTASDGTVLESGTELTAADGTFTRTMTRNGPDGETVTETAGFDADGNLVSSTATTTSATAAAATAAGTTDNAAASSDASGASGSSDASDSGNTTTVTMAFTSEGMEQTTTITDPQGNIVSQKVKEIPFFQNGRNTSFGSLLEKGDGLSDLIGQYASNRYGASRYASQEASAGSGSQTGGLSVEA